MDPDPIPDMDLKEDFQPYVVQDDGQNILTISVKEDWILVTDVYSFQTGFELYDKNKTTVEEVVEKYEERYDEVSQ